MLDVVLPHHHWGEKREYLLEESLQDSSSDLKNLCQGVLKLLWWHMVAQYFTETLYHGFSL